MKLAAVLVALALAVPATSHAQVFRGEPTTAKAKPKAKAKAKAKPKRAKARPRAEPAAEAAPPEAEAEVAAAKPGKSRARNVDKVAETDVVVIIDGE